MYFSALQGHGTSFSPGASGAPTECMQGTTRFSALSISLNTRQPDPRHDAHVHHDVRRIRKLHADLRHRRSDRPHAERQHVHGAALHAPVEELLQLLAHLERIFPVVGGASVIFRERADEGAVLDARDIVGIRARVETARPQLLIELGEGAAVNHLGTKLVVFFLRPVHPMNGGGFGESRHLFDPAEQVIIFAQRL